MIVRCYKCGKEFSVREGVRSDICPACMSFIDVKKAQAEMRGETALSKQQPEKSEESCAAKDGMKTQTARPAVDIYSKTAQSKPGVSAVTERSEKSEKGAEEKEISVSAGNTASERKLTARILPVEIKGRGQEKASVQPEKENVFAVRETTVAQKGKSDSAGTDLRGLKRADAQKEAAAYEERLSQAEKFLRENRFSEAREAFEACLRERDDWRADFGVVLSATRGLYDLSLFSEVSDHASRALDEMPQEAKEKLGEHYVPQLQRMREETQRALDARKDSRAEEDTRKTKKKSALVFPFAVIVIIAVFFGNIVINEEFGSPEVVFSVYGPILILLVAAAVFAIAAYAVKQSKAAKKRESELSKMRQSRKEECERLKDKLFTIDYLCGRFQN